VRTKRRALLFVRAGAGDEVAEVKVGPEATLSPQEGYEASRHEPVVARPDLATDVAFDEEPNMRGIAEPSGVWAPNSTVKCAQSTNIGGVC
jgi:hypothetical protein